MQIDHVFIRVAPGGPEAELLRAFGLIEGSGNTHPGQGTANRRFFFANAFLELLWIADAEEIATDAPLSEPMWFYTSSGKAPAEFEDGRRQPLLHPAGLRNITALRCTLPTPAGQALTELTPAARASGVQFAPGDTHLLEITFDHAARGQRQDFRPSLPLIFHY